ncbi:subclass B1 metallo-beta-lactamase [Maribacter sp. 2210JD10-5]|uniref:subclass B1 metallo-beta-lactamase n=1 Tax=Maribacter sp. 2210JD10-5 TaxID=3386272 RepID=UPI0039BC3D9C
MKKLVLLVFFSALLFSCYSNRTVLYPLVSETLKIEKVSENVYIHTSYLDIPNYGKYPCNGLVFFSKKEAIVLDTPTNDSSSAELLKWITNVQNKKVKAVIINHFHNDCLGGLKMFHERHIKSYANISTIQLAKKSNETVPQIAFDNQIEHSIGNETIITEYFGPGHTSDNVVSYIPSEALLFGGCLIKEMGAGKGNLADANTTQWPVTVNKIKLKYKNLITVIPGHGKCGGKELLDYTIKLFEEE